ncbi:MAG: hypothetical protein JSV49_10480 [Thermoplasmata archaeon]|nr:MAG: hypothetical protein JSV49_10480 [Thermoplasmata archaeon]
MRKVNALLMILILMISSIAIIGTSGTGALSTENSGEIENSQPLSRKTYDNITTFDGGIDSAEYTFGTGGISKKLNVTFAKRTKVLGAQVDVEGRASLKTAVFDYNDTKNNSAWHGNTPNAPPSKGPKEYENTSFVAKEYTAIQNADNSRAEHNSDKFTTQSRLYHLFKFNLSSTVPSKFQFLWVGRSYIINSIGLTKNEVYVYIFCPQNTTWVKVDEQVYMHSTGPKELYVNKEIDSAGNYVDSDTSAVYFIVMGLLVNPSAKDRGTLGTDFVKLTAYISGGVTYPTGVSLDVGDDSDPEWTHSGTLDTKVTIDDGEGLKTELQEHIDAAGTDEGTVTVVFLLSAQTAGRLWIGNLKIYIEELEHNDPPEEVPGKLYLFEMIEDDTASGDNLINLRECFTDIQEDSEDLRSEIEDNGDPVTLEAVLDDDGYHVDFIPAENFFGTVAFRVKAIDSGADEVPDTFDDLVAKSRYFNVTVKPVNDPPQINAEGVTFTVYETQSLIFNATAEDVDDSEFAWELQASIEGSGAELDNFGGDSTKAQIELPPQPQNVGKTIYLNLTVEDGGGKQGQNFKARGYANVSVEILNVNDAPEFVELILLPDLYTDPMIPGTVVILKNDQAAEEDEYYNISLVADDADLGVEPNEVLEFSLIQEEAIDGMLDIDQSSGLILLLPTNADVGTVSFTVRVTDWKGEYAQQDIEVQVKNRNDAPFNARIVLPEERKFNADDKITFKGECDDDDFLIPDSLESLTFRWFSNHSVQTLGYGDEIYDITLEPGLHTITLEVMDNEGESAFASIELEIISKDDTDPDPGDDPDDDPDDKDKDDDKQDDDSLLTQGTSDDKKAKTLYWALLAVIVVIVVIVLILFFVIKPKKKKPEEEEIEGEPQIPMAPMPLFPPGPEQYGQMYPVPMPVPQPMEVPMQQPALSLPAAQPPVAPELPKPVPAETQAAPPPAELQNQPIPGEANPPSAQPVNSDQ